MESTDGLEMDWHCENATAAYQKIIEHEQCKSRLKLSVIAGANKPEDLRRSFQG